MVVTRIAPSPTGDPHVGTAYIALFNYAWARRNGGRFIVRIEDTDRARYVPGAEERILAALKWLGLSYDEGPDVGGPHGPYRQSERLPLYQKYAEELLKRGWAYRAFETPEELEQIRKEKGGYDGRARNIPPEEAEERARRGEPHVIRLKVPRPGTTEVKDELRGVVVYDNQEIPDVVLLKSDGYPTYHLANVVDDHLMGVTDVIRAEEWLVSTPIHVLLYRAFGWEAPRFYHMPLLRNPDKTKISKRKSHTSLDWYKAEGFLPEALRNYLCLMGFSMPDGREIFTLEEFIQAFTWERVSLGGPVFDLEKLRWMNGKYIREVLSLEEVAERVKPFLREAGLSWESEAYLRRAVELMRPRFDTLKEFPEKARYLFTEDYPVSEKAQRKLEEGLPLLKELYPRLRTQEEWTEAALEALLRGFAAEKGVKLGQVAQPLRAALTGSLETPGLFEILALLGKERALRRLERALA
ncbi:glutamate--tRNA ligase [Thermus thermophilus]|uniref:Glutamate--tRNA ligase n=1 Tax=Thermus thermophilus (strain ATCC BAA-163 / DSM 7039 / HB27) TaxID=262724 RepID=SYE_THET2|nr:glutamate--tRNA ligase [Thermus thermophilus]Q72LI9.1 RecName: Full=Glutamate--tRNA ligase; AltName: Full=Glutamyl-tRNA synthetase; Short=GluRS [Thermus thermophilus HB27]AAS80418.1 glutamyl-tRNA synthetase [Thermus thermophilus HB27]QMV30120.1 glutamate--tRNA ligase [Thermus thermophilus]WMV95476.1 glutamate--tRNA ligase [Thermus thermophilus HB27]BBL92943.1 glutamate--tRNA ligase [Thermus thermophilus]